MSQTSPFIEPDWPAPEGIFSLATTRFGGLSAPPRDSFNLAHHVCDDEAAVAGNRGLLQRRLPPGSVVQWLQQVHGCDVVEAGTGAEYPRADAVWSRQRGAVCAVLTADCLPVLLCDREATVVAAAHAGWRGLAAGVLEATVTAMGIDPHRLLAWLGPAIGPAAFEVGPEVREAFLQAPGPAPDEQIARCFRPSETRSGHFMADLYGLARLRLNALGIEQVSGGGFCTFSERARFFSYRRDGETGRMATLIGLL